MYNYMDRSNNTLLIIVSITTLCIRCYGTIANISKSNWAIAHMHCREEGKMLPNLLIHTLSNESFFWTGHYTRLSEWIKIIGCFEESVVNTLTKKSHEMYFPSAGRCQEVCLASNYSVFGVQIKKCVCLEEITRQRSRGANYCSSSCSGRYTAKTNIKFKNDCGGLQTYNLFKSGSEMENSAFTTNECLSIQCPEKDKKFIHHTCNLDIAQICNTTRYDTNTDWQSSSVKCKLTHNSYLFGDVDLTDPGQACNLIQKQPEGPSWLGIAREIYIGIDGLEVDMVQTKRNPIMCLKCNSKDCIFADCSEFNSFVCLKGPETTFTTPTGSITSTTPHGTVSTSTSPTGSTTSTSPHGTVSTSTSPTGSTAGTTLHGSVSISTSPTGTTISTTPHGIAITSNTSTSTNTSTTRHRTASTEHSIILIFEPSVDATGSTNKKTESMIKNQDGNTTVIMVVVPVTVIIILGLIALLFVILWRRRQTKNNADTRHDQHSEKNDADLSLQNNYFVLEKTETYSEVNSTKDATYKGCKNTHNACYDDYDHLGENFIKKDEEDTYHHAFFPSNEDESDYGIRNITAECQMENPYSHTNTLANNEHKTISIDA